MKKILNNKNLIDLNFSNNVDGALKFPYGNSAATFADEGWVRFNNITKKLEIFVSSAWGKLATEDYVNNQIASYVSGAFDLSNYLLKEGGTVVSCLNFPNTGTVFNNAIRFGNPGTGISYNSVSNSFSFSIGNAEFFTLSSQGFIVGNKILDNKFFIDFTNNYVNLGSALPSFSIGNFNINSDSDIDLNLNSTDSNQFINFFSSSNSKFSIGLNFNNNKFVITSANNVLETFFAIDSTGKIAINSLINSTFTELFEVFGTAKFVDVVVSSKNKYFLPLSAGITGQVLRTTGPNGRLYWDNITVSSFGTGEQIALGVSANKEIQFRTLVGGGILDATTVGNIIQLSAPKAEITTSSLGGVSMGLAVSAGTGNRNELLIRGLTGGGIVEVSALTNTIVISAAPFTQNVTVSSFGGGNQITLGVSGNREIQFRTLVGGGNVEVSAFTNTIVISATILEPVEYQGNYKLLLSTNVVNLSTISVTNLNTYNEVEMVLLNIAPSANAQLRIQMAINSNTNWITTGSYRYIQSISRNISAVVSCESIVNNFINMGALDNSGNRRERSMSGIIKFYNPGLLGIISARVAYFSEVKFMPSASEYRIVEFDGDINVVGTLYGVRVFMQSDRFFSGVIKVYGRK